MFRWTGCFFGQRQRVGSAFAVERTEAQGGFDETREGAVVDYSFNCAFLSVTPCFPPLVTEFRPLAPIYCGVFGGRHGGGVAGSPLPPCGVVPQQCRHQPQP